MFYIRNSKDPSRVLFVAESNTDMDCLKLLYDAHIIFGMLKLYDTREDKNKCSEEFKFLHKNFSLATGFAQVNEVKDFVPKKEQNVT